MNDEAIFFKTLAGDEAVRERTRLVQRNLRMVLILVDGFADVAELKRKVGDVATVESALAELERLGLIESIDARMARNSAAAAAVAEPAAAEPADAAAPAATFDEDEDEEALPLLSEVVAPAAAGGAPEAAMVPEVMAVEEESDRDGPDVEETTDEGPLTDGLTVFDGETAAKAWMVPGMGGAVQQPVAPPASAKPSPLAGLSGWWQRYRASRAQAKEEELYERAYGRSEPAAEAGFEGAAESPAEPPSPEPEKVAIRPIRRGARTSIGPGRILILGLLGVVLVLLLVIVFFPYGRYRPDFERHLALALGEPATITDVRVAFTPYPAITLEGVSVGEAGYARADAVHLLPEPVSLFGIHRYREVRVEGLQIKEAGLQRIARWLAPSALGDVKVSRLTLSNLSLDLGIRPVTGLSGTVELDERQGLARVVFGEAEGGPQVVAVPRPEGLALTFLATGWKLPFGPPLSFSRLELDALLVPGRLSIGRIEGRLYEGGVAGSGELSWTGEPRLALGLELVRLQADKFLEVFSAQPGLEGSVSSTLRVLAAAPSFSGLVDSLRMEGSFEATQGNLRRIDLAEALRAGSQGAPVTGGTTRFEEFTGTFAVDEAAVRLNRLRLTSGLLHAFGQLAVSRKNGTIAGSATAEMRGTATTVRSALSLSGKAADPVLKAGQ